MIFAILLIIFFNSNAYAEVSPIASMDQNNVPVINDNMNFLNSSINSLNKKFSNLNSCTQGSIVYFSSTGIINCISPGTSGQFFKTQGINNNPIWSNISITSTVGSISTASALTERTNNNNTFTKLKEVYIAISGNYTITYDYKNDHGGGSTGSDIIIYKNGTALGSDNTNSPTSYTAYTEDINGWTVGDLLQVYARNGGGANLVYVKNLLVKTSNPPINTVTID